MILGSITMLLLLLMAIGIGGLVALYQIAPETMAHRDLPVDTGGRTMGELPPHPYGHNSGDPVAVEEFRQRHQETSDRFAERTADSESFRTDSGVQRGSGYGSNAVDDRSPGESLDASRDRGNGSIRGPHRLPSADEMMAEMDAEMARLRQRSDESMRRMGVPVFPRPSDSAEAKQRFVESMTTVTDPASGRDRSDPAMASPSPSSQPLSMTDLIERVEPSVLRIDVQMADGESQGSGFFAGDPGTIVTNYHVIEGAQSVTVRNHRGQTARVDGWLKIDPDRDLAVLKMGRASMPMPPLPLSPDLPRKGESVASFGSPLGFDFTAAEGTVSGIRDHEGLKQSLLGSIPAEDIPGGKTGMSFIQTTAAISPGNSGGPLVSFRGELVGVNSWTVPSGQNLNFAVPAMEVRNLLASLTARVRSWSELPPPSGRSSSSPGGGGSVDRGTIRAGGERPKFVSSGSYGELRRWQTGSSPVSAMAATDDGQTLAVAAMDGTLTVLDLVKGTTRWTLRSSEAPVTELAFASRGTRLFAGRTYGRSTLISVHATSDGNETKVDEFLKPSRGHLSAMAVAPSGQTVFAAWQNGLTASWQRNDRLGTYQALLLIDVRILDGLVCTEAAFSADSGCLAVGDSRGWMSLVRMGQESMTKLSDGKVFDGEVTDIEPYGRDGVVASGGDGAVKVVRPNASSKLSPQTLIAGGPSIAAIALSDDNRNLAVLRRNDGLAVYDRGGRREVEVFGAYSSPGTAVAIGNSGRFLYAGHSDGTVLMFRMPKSGN